jgi:methylenetetrahydrofolate reductase (NADPH)
MNQRTEAQTSFSRPTFSLPTFSIELFPPKDEAGEVRLWAAVEELAALRPDFISVTYGAGGSTRDRTLRIATQLTQRTGIPTVAHLTCVGSTQEELIAILDQYQSAQIDTILAVRGDPVGGPSAPWVATPGGFDHAEQLVELAAARGFKVGVAAFPDVHPASNGNFEQDVSALLRKEQKGASFATTQFFFDSAAYTRLVNALSEAGSQLPVIAGVLPVTNVKQFARMAELSGAPIPTHIVDRFMQVADDEEAVVNLGIEVSTELCRQLIASGAPGIHFLTMNKASATSEIVKNLGLR